MAQSLGKIVVHTVFSTKDRRPFLRDRKLREELHCYIGSIISQFDCQPIIVGGTEDHIHILSTLSRTCEAAKMVKEAKRVSTNWLKEQGIMDFAWQSGYGIFSVSASQVETARRYIASQEEHHSKISFQDEYRQLLQRHGIEFDERFVWD